MAKWKFESLAENGVYVMERGEKISYIKKQAAGAGYFFARVNVKNANDKRALLGALARALKFPAYFGMNWDALEDSLRDLSPARGYVIVLSGFSALPEKMAEEAEILTKILESSARYWQAKDIPFLIFLS